MLKLQNISLAISDDPETRPLLDKLNLQFDRGHFVAILGPSGCGKTTLIKSIAGILEPTGGSIHWLGRDLANDRDLDPHEVGYIPQFSIAHDFLTVRESVNNALQLRVAGLSAEHREERVEQILREVGLSEIGDRLVRVLSGGQKRRIALALEIVTSPSLLLADEVTSGLDAKSEDDFVRLMRRFAREQHCIVLSVTHSLRHIELYDSVVILNQGCLAYHGPGHLIAHYFNLPDLEDLFPQLTNREPEDWHRSWLKHRAFYLDQVPRPQVPAIREPSRDTSLLPEPELQPVVSVEHADSKKNDNLLADAIANDELADDKPPIISDEEPGSRPLPRTPGPLAQFFVLLARRWKIFFRDRSQIILQLALILGFPCLVVIFALDGLPQIKNLSLTSSGHDIINATISAAKTLQQNSHVGSLVSGLIMFQVILLTLIASNNSAREIAAERLIFEKEKFAGLHPSAYVASKAAFLAILVLVQSLWMGIFVNFICKFPGDLLAQLAILIAVNAAMTSVCLGISSLSRTTEQASLISIYLVGFQLPLSGVVLALPEFVQWFSRLTIASYWGWSGFLKTMTDTRLYDSVTPILQTSLSNLPVCYWVLIFHTIIGLFLAYIGCKSSKWE